MKKLITIPDEIVNSLNKIKTHKVVDVLTADNDALFYGTNEECYEWIRERGFGYRIQMLTLSDMEYIEVNKNTSDKALTYQLICTSYTKIENKLVLKDNWIEAVLDNKYMLELIEKWNLPDDFKYPSKNSISDVIKSKIEVEGVIIHLRIVRF